MVAKVGLTGGIGSGKSTVADCFAGLGVTVIDADDIGRALTEPGGAALSEILDCFGAAMADDDGRLDRQKLARVVFASPEKRKQLESILHPPIRAAMHARAAQLTDRYCILAIPLLVESAQHREMERVTVVKCSRETRRRRLQQHRAMTVAEIDRVMENQASDAARLTVADDVIDNDGAMDALAPQVAKLHAAYLKLF